MKSTLLSAALAFSTLATSSMAFGFAAASWSCVSNKPGLTATYEASMAADILTTVQARKNKQPVRTTYFTRDPLQPNSDSKFMSQDDPKQSDLQKKAGTFPSELMEFVLSANEKKTYDFGFKFLGADFLCSRNKSSLE